MALDKVHTFSTAHKALLISLYNITLKDPTIVNCSSPLAPKKMTCTPVLQVTVEASSLLGTPFISSPSLTSLAPFLSSFLDFIYLFEKEH